MLIKSIGALEHTGNNKLIVAGGVGANQLLRNKLRQACLQIGATVYYPRPSLCTDNGAMIAFAGWYRRRVAQNAGSIIARPRWPLDELLPVS